MNLLCNVGKAVLFNGNKNDLSSQIHLVLLVQCSVLCGSLKGLYTSNSKRGLVYTRAVGALQVQGGGGGAQQDTYSTPPLIWDPIFPHQIRNEFVLNFNHFYASTTS